MHKPYCSAESVPDPVGLFVNRLYDTVLVLESHYGQVDQVILARLDNFTTGIMEYETVVWEKRRFCSER